MEVDTKGLRTDLRKKLGGVSTQAITNRLSAVQKKRPMTREDALLVEAYREGIQRLEKYGADPETLTRVAGHVAALRYGSSQPEPTEDSRTRVSSTEFMEPQTFAQKFRVRNFHPRVVRSSRKAFVNRLWIDAVRKAFVSVNNRVKRMTSSSKDGHDLMGWAFSSKVPQLQMTGLATESEQNEHKGTRLLMQGSVTAMRNPRSHEDEWPPDEDEAYVLEALGLASLLHRLLDRCEEYAEK